MPSGPPSPPKVAFCSVSACYFFSFRHFYVLVADCVQDGWDIFFLTTSESAFKQEMCTQHFLFSKDLQFAVPIRGIGGAGSISSMSEDFGVYGSDPRSKVDPMLDRIPIRKTALTAGTPKGTLHIPGSGCRGKEGGMDMWKDYELRSRVVRRSNQEKKMYEVTRNYMIAICQVMIIDYKMKGLKFNFFVRRFRFCKLLLFEGLNCSLFETWLPLRLQWFLAPEHSKSLLCSGGEWYEPSYQRQVAHHWSAPGKELVAVQCGHVGN